MDQQRNINDRNALHVFPEEVWEEIMENFYTTEDIKNLLKAFSELRDLPKGHQFSWCIGDVMPLIMSKFLTVHDIYSCRLVSKRWRNGVGTSLEAHPDRLPYRSTRQTLLSEHHINYSPVNITTNFRKFFTSGYADVAKDPVNENPFPGRRIYAKFIIPEGTNKHYNLSEALPLFKVFGHHVWYFSVQFINHEGHSDEIFFTKGLTPLFECLKHLPNLLSLDINGTFNYIQTGSFKLNSNTPLTVLPFRLESLNISKLFRCLEDIYSSILTTVGSSREIQKLQISADMWKENYATLFPNLTEICINDFLMEALKIFGDLQTLHFLRKLKIEGDNLNICHLLKTLADYTCQVESLEIVVRYFELEDSSWDHSTVLPALHDLKLKTTKGIIELPFGFSKALPELKCLTLSCLDTYRYEYETHHNNAISLALYRFHVKKRREWNAFSVLWELLPKLGTLTIFDIDTFFNYRYARECKEIFKFKSLPHCSYDAGYDDNSDSDDNVHMNWWWE